MQSNPRIIAVTFTAMIVWVLNVNHAIGHINHIPTAVTQTQPEKLILAQASNAPQTLSPAQANDAYASTGVWQRAPRLVDTPPTSIALDVILSDDVNLPDTVAPSAILAQNNLDTDRGLLDDAPQPNPDAVQTPEVAEQVATDANDAIVTTGLPALNVTPRPLWTQVELDRMAQPTPVEQAQNEPALTPILRPTTIENIAQVQDPNAPSQAASAGGVNLVALVPYGNNTGLRPALRPSQLIAGIDPQNPDITSTAVTAAGATVRFTENTELAASVSQRPNARPSNFAAIVTSAIQQTAFSPQQNAPYIPRNTDPLPGGVAAAATQEDGIRFRNINLIGVYGRPNARRALVRVGNRRYIRVEVGSDLDGGQVVAIDATSLNYVKSGRTRTIELP